MTLVPVSEVVYAVASVSGGVTERYTLTVTFSDSDHFEGTFNANLGGVGGLLGCLVRGVCLGARCGGGFSGVVGVGACLLGGFGGGFFLVCGLFGAVQG